MHYVEDLLFERGIDFSHETVRLWWNRFGPMCAAIHANVHNHCNLERHLIDRETYKTRRPAALAECQNLMA